MFAVSPLGQRVFLGAAWGPVSVLPSSPYFVGARRPAIPVAELSSITQALRMLRAVSFTGTIHWSADSLYALGIVLSGMGATTELDLVTAARTEASYAKQWWDLKGHRTPSHMGYPPNECADVVARMGRLQFQLSRSVQDVLQIVPFVQRFVQQRIPFLLDQALLWNEVEALPDELMELSYCRPRRAGQLTVVRCASPNVLTVHPQEERPGKEGASMDSHRRLDLVSQFQAAKSTVIGLQETRCRRPRAKDTRPYRVFSTATGPRGQAGLELWVLKTWPATSETKMVLHSDQRVLVANLSTQIGAVQVTVAHALGSSYSLAEREEWWKHSSDIHTKVYKRNQRQIWLIDANATVGFIHSSAIGSVHAEQESFNGEWFSQSAPEV